MYQGFKQIVVEKRNKTLLVKFSNPKKNCLNRFAYVEIARVFQEAAKDDDITIVVVTGNGEIFTAGNDLSQSTINGDIDSYLNESIDILKGMIRALLDCPKVVIALVNGPCIGIGSTLAGLCDLIWCSETAYFQTPFTKLGLVPEACSSYLFPLLIGRSKATEMLLFSEKISAEEALRYNFVSKVFKMNELDSVIWPTIQQYSNLPRESMTLSKKLLRMHERNTLNNALDAECEELRTRFLSEEFLNAMIQFSSRHKKASKL